MHTTGQFGNALSGHYDDFVELDQALKYMPMSYGARECGRGYVLVLKPD